MLSGWQSTTTSGSGSETGTGGQSSSSTSSTVGGVSGATVTRQDLMVAKKVLEQFDIVLLSDWYELI